MRRLTFNTAATALLLFTIIGSARAQKGRLMDEPDLGAAAEPDPLEVAPADAEPSTSAQVPGDLLEPNHLYPWVVRFASSECKGVLIHPHWVLTAAHCVPNWTFDTNIVWLRTDPRTGEIYRAERSEAGQHYSNVYVPDGYQGGHAEHDIALIKLAPDFDLNPFLAVVSLPDSPCHEGLNGVVASLNETTDVEREVRVFRGQTGGCGPSSSAFTIFSPTQLCEGDSGQGFITVEGGKLVVRGIVSLGAKTCAQRADMHFADVFAHRDWIISTIRANDAPDVLEANVRVRWTGDNALGVMSVTCGGKTYAGRMGIAGLEVKATCDPNQPTAVSCSVVHAAGATVFDTFFSKARGEPVITGFTRRTLRSDGTVDEYTSELFTPGYNDQRQWPQGIAHEFVCQVGNTFTPEINEDRLAN